MAIPADMQRAVLFGSSPGGEIWETGFWLHGGLPDSESAANSQAELLWTTFLSEADPPVIPFIVGSLLSAQGAVRGMRVYVYPNGGSKAAFVGEYQPGSPLVGTSNYFLPDQCCLVATLNTGLSGRRNRGRMYFPASGCPTQSNGQTNSTVTGNLATDLAAAFSDLRSSDAGNPVVMSNVASTFHPITSIKVDTKIDIQRRRANKQLAAGVSTAPVS